MSGLFSVEAVRRRETRASRGAEDPRREATGRVAALFALVALGVFTKWLWDALWAFVAEPDAGLQLGDPPVLLARAALSLIVAALSFVAIYNRIDTSTGESWAPWFLAFQNGFFWQATFDAVARSFGS